MRQSFSRAQAKVPLPRPDPANPYTVGWICARYEEYMCACRMLDEKLPAPHLVRGDLDNNTYVFGRIAGHYVVITCLPAGRHGGTTAAHAARDMIRTFPKLQFALSVGIAGGAPTADNDIRLGDVVVGVPNGDLPAVIEWDHGARLQDGRFVRTGHLDAPPQKLLQVIPDIQRRYADMRQPDGIAENLKRLRDMKQYRRPACDDKLYDAHYAHVGGPDCGRCHDIFTVQRAPRKDQRVVQVHYGTIGSGNADVQDPRMRDSYANEPRMKFLCFDMTSAGLMNSIPCLPIRGISNYCDSHANDKWNHYAALTAASYARELLLALPAEQRVDPTLPQYGEVVRGRWHGRLRAKVKLWISSLSCKGSLSEKDPSNVTKTRFQLPFQDQPQGYRATPEVEKYAE